MEIKPSVVAYEMNNGDTVGMSLNMAGIYSLKQSNKELYEKVNKVLMDGTEDIVQVAEVLYAAFKIANPDTDMDMMKFLEKANTSVRYNMEIVNGMITRKKK